MIFRMTLEELGHPQPHTPVHCDNATAVGIANNTVKRQRSRSMEMRYFWVCDKIAQDAYNVKWHPGQENLAGYQSKHHTGAHHQAVRPWYLHEQSSPLSPKGTYVMYPYHESLEDRVLSHARYIRYPITTNPHM